MWELSNGEEVSTQSSVYSLVDEKCGYWRMEQATHAHTTRGT